MPQLGESVTEGTIGKWLKKPGDTVEKYESLAEVITDKVNAEIPSPVAGVIKELKVEEGATVPVGTEILAIDEGGDAAAEAPAAPQPAVATVQAEASPVTPASAPVPAPEPAPAPVAAAPAATAPSGTDNGRTPQTSQPPVDMGAAVAAAMPQQPAQSYSGSTGGATARAATGGVESEEEMLRRRSTPAVRRLAEEHNVELGQVKGTGLGGRVTREDILQYIAQRGAAPAQAPAAAPTAPAPAPTMPTPAPAPMPAPTMPLPSFAQGDVVMGLTPMRRAIAEHMVRSVHTSPHAWTSVEIDMTNVVRYRDSISEAFKQREGVPISYYAFFVKAAIDAIKVVPMANATWSDEQGVILKRDINVGVPVDMGEDKGLIVPVIHGADNYSVTGLARKIYEYAQKAKAGKLTLDEIQGGTITINNTGALGTYMTSSIINQPQACLITLESIVKRPVVIDDAIAIRSMTFSCIALDHRVLDGAVGAKFLRQIKANLEGFNPAAPGL
jgi:2-oxoisovalerate dehydrogenase E2 component (dihydrolipoyl transacylase)